MIVLVQLACYMTFSFLDRYGPYRQPNRFREDYKLLSDILKRMTNKESLK